MEYINILGKENVKKAIIAIGQEIIEQAEDVCRQLDNVNCIKIEALLQPSEIATVNIKKEYVARFKDNNKN